MQDAMSQHDFFDNHGMHYMSNRVISAMHKEVKEEYIQEHDFHLLLQEQMHHSIPFHAKMICDIMYFHQALQQPNAGEFVKALVKEGNGHIDMESRQKLVKCSKIPKDVDFIPLVWSMRHKCNLTTSEVSKYKSRLNIYGRNQVDGMNSFHTYARW